MRRSGVPSACRRPARPPAHPPTHVQLAVRRGIRATSGGWVGGQPKHTPSCVHTRRGGAFEEHNSRGLAAASCVGSMAGWMSVTADWVGRSLVWAAGWQCRMGCKLEGQQC